MEVPSVGTSIGYAFTAVEKVKQHEKLLGELEEAKVYVATVKNFINDGIQSRIEACTLPDLAVAVNTYQDFFRKNCQGKSNKVAMLAFPEWYRMELQASLSVVQHALDKYRMEMQSYTNAVVEGVMFAPGAPKELLAKIRSDLQRKNSQCARVLSFFRERNAPNPTWDTCPECGRREDQQTPAESFLKEESKKKKGEK